MGLHLLFSWRDQDGRHHREEGVIRDISAAGAFLFASTCPPVGRRFRINLLLPPLERSVGPIEMRMNGRVLRVETEPAEGQAGFAASSDKFCLWDVSRLIERNYTGARNGRQLPPQRIAHA